MAQTARIPLESRTQRVTFVEQDETETPAGKGVYLCSWADAWRFPSRTEVKPQISSKLAERYYIHSVPFSGAGCDYPIMPFATGRGHLKVMWEGQDYSALLAQAAALIEEQALVEQKQTSLEQEFNELALQWYRETRNISSAEQIVLHPAYQKIIGMGKDALPFVFSELKKTRGHWIWALAMILRDDKAKPGMKFREAVDAWLTWGENNSYI
jgi:hypothetical protein